MATFSYQAKDRGGNTINGVIEAAEERSAAEQLREMGYWPLRIGLVPGSLTTPSAVAPPPAMGPLGGVNAPPGGASSAVAAPASAPAASAGMASLSGPGRAQTAESVEALFAQPTTAPQAAPYVTPEMVGRGLDAGRSADSPLAPRVGSQERISIAPFLETVPLPDLAMMYRQLATLVNAGVPMVGSLETLARQTRNGRLQAILREAALSVAGGNALSRTLASYPHVFSEMQVEMIRGAEVGGMLERMCHRIADYLEREIEIRRKINRETLYPKIVLFVAACVLLLLSFLKAGQEGFFGLLKWFVGSALAIGGALWLFKFANQFPAFGATWDRVKMMIPGAGGVARRYATARFARALSALYGGGILLPTAVAIAARACGNRAIGQTMLDQIPYLMAGNSIGSALERSGLLSPIAVQMARTGEQTGSLDAMLDKVADYLESEADQKAHQQAVALGVASIIVAGIVVLLIAVSFYVGGINSVLNDATKE
jgi:type IV pilus assembly protein PilC